MDSCYLKIQIINEVINVSIEEDGVRPKFFAPINDFFLFFNNRGFRLSDPQNFKCPSEGWKVRLCFHSPVDLLLNPKNIYEYGQKFLLANQENFYPIIHLALEDIFLCQYKRYSKYTDSSIWNYFICIPSENEYDRISTEKELFRVFKEIISNYTNNLYKLYIAQEYADFNARLLNSSYLATKGEGHADSVSPFLFHSEKWCLKNIIENEGNFLLYKWCVLLLDDHVLSPLNKIDNGKGSDKGCRSEYIIKEGPDKLRIISNNIRSVFPDCKIGYIDHRSPLVVYSEVDDTIIPISESLNIVFYCVSTLADSMEVLSKRRFEIVLLDYLLGKSVEFDDSREYAYELFTKTLKQIKENNYKDKVFGPHGRLFCMFISAFTTAVNERLLAEGLHKSEETWHIADGACPTNTPYLFLYNLLHLMKKRLDDMGLEKLTIPNYKENKKDFEKCHIKSKIIDEIFISDDIAREENTSVRQRANDKFNKVLSLLYHYKNLLNDTHNPGNIFESDESVLATDFIEKNPDLGGFLEHLMQLVYLTAYGTVRQWPEMWEEYQFIKTVVGVQENIENYILSLKNNNIGS